MPKNKKIAFVEKDDSGDWWSHSTRDIAEGLNSLGYRVIPFHKDKLSRIDITPETPVKGSIRTVRNALRLLKVPQPENQDIPKELRHFARRKMWQTTLGELRKTDPQVFVKPLKWQKAFNGHAWVPQRGYGVNCRKKIGEDLESKDFPDDFPVLAQELVKFKGEWRCYVLNGKVIQICQYRYYATYGEPVLQPSKEEVQCWVDRIEKPKASFALDVGFTKSKKSAAHLLTLIEMNEGFSVGNYGISKLELAQVFEARWKEMVAA